MNEGLGFVCLRGLGARDNKFCHLATAVLRNVIGLAANSFHLSVSWHSIPQSVSSFNIYTITVLFISLFRLFTMLRLTE